VAQSGHMNASFAVAECSGEAAEKSTVMPSTLIHLSVHRLLGVDFHPEQCYDIEDTFLFIK